MKAFSPLLVLSLWCCTAAAGVPNDMFADSARLEGTNVTFAANCSGATFEPGEPNPGATNTIWASWAAPAAGRARFYNFSYVALYTGPSIERLQQVRTVGMDNGRFDFLAEEGTVYHFQIAAPTIRQFSLQFLGWEPATNDVFASACQLAGDYVNGGLDKVLFPICHASSEPGEPAHLGPAPFRSLWWKWTAPVHGRAVFFGERSLETNFVVAVYQGSSIEALSQVAKGTNGVTFPITGGQEYYLATAAPTNATGDVLVYSGIYQSFETRPVPGNLLREPSWEGSETMEPVNWGVSGSLGGVINGYEAADGRCWAILPTGTEVWQDLPTVPGRIYAVRFAMRASSNFVGDGSGDGRMRVLWDGHEVGAGVLPEAHTRFWNWAGFTAVASKSTTRISFVNAARVVEADAFSVVSRTDPPQIVVQPGSLTVFSGGVASFSVGASGSAPLSYRWLFNGAPAAGLTNAFVILDPVSTNHGGIYQAIVTNAFGTATSASMTLTVEAPAAPVIYWQPYGDTVVAGGYHCFSVVAAGTPPLSYQWFKDDVQIENATNRMLLHTSVAPADAGIYTVRVANHAGIVWSLGARLGVSGAGGISGEFYFRNCIPGVTNADAPVYDLDGVTRLNGSNYLAQLYAGAALELLRPAGQPSAFQSGFAAGFFYPQLVGLPGVEPGSNAVLQVRAWDAAKGSTYEEARAFGGRFGRSELLSVRAGGGTLPAADLEGLRSFNLQAGMPEFAAGRISLLERQPEGIILWAHLGQPGFRYLIEKSIHGFEWRPFTVITNLTSTVVFTDSASSGSSTVFYRSRIID